MLVPLSPLGASLLLALTPLTNAVLMRNAKAVTPPMGWNNWNAFGCDVSEDLLVDTAARMVEIGLKDAGYEYVILDDCWSNGRYENGTLRPEFEKFPNGMAHVADAVHELGLMYGMYSNAGRYTCGQYEGSLGYETLDATTFAEWGVDYLKYDNCFNEGQSGNANISYARYEVMSNALNATGRQIHYGMCNWGQDRPFDWAYLIANSWRATGDIIDSFDRFDPRCPCEEKEGIECGFPGWHCSIMNIINKVVWYIHRSQQGGWNDMDMLTIGNGGMNDDEYKLEMTMWAAMRSPLLMGTDIRSLDARSYSIYTNPAILALSQDPTGNSAQRIWRQYMPNNAGEIQMWSGALAQGDQVVILLNAATTAMNMSADLADIFIDNREKAMSSWDVYDLWANRMPDAVAGAILEANDTMAAGANVTAQYLFNSTAMSFEEGIMGNHSLLMGQHVGTAQAEGCVEAEVPRHGVAAFRLRPNGTPVIRKRDEL